MQQTSANSKESELQKFVRVLQTQLSSGNIDDAKTCACEECAVKNARTTDQVVIVVFKQKPDIQTKNGWMQIWKLIVAVSVLVSLLWSLIEAIIVIT